MVRFRRCAIAVGIAASGAVIAAGPTLAGTITAPSARPYNVPLNAQGTGPAPFPIAAAGYPKVSIIYAMICDGTPPSAPLWDPNINCDNGTSPAGRPTGTAGRASWDPSNKNQMIGVFDGPAPSANFNCLYPGEVKPANGLPSFTNCQLRVATNNSAVTSDQAFITLVLPRPTCVSHCQPSPALGTAGGSSAASGASGQGASLGGSGAKAGQLTSRGGGRSSWLAMTGANILRLVLVALALVACGMLLVVCARRRRRGTVS